MMNLNAARTVADSAAMLRIATGGEIAAAIDRLHMSEDKADAARVAKLAETLAKPRVH
jgi:hypothetical protein